MKPEDADELRVGDRVEMIVGPLAGRRGAVEGFDGWRIYVMIETFGRVAPVWVKAHQIRRVRD